MRSISAELQHVLRAMGRRAEPTSDVLVKDVIFLDDIVDDLLGTFVEDQHLPL